MEVDIKKLKQLREETSAGVMDCRKALESSGGDLDKAREYLKKKGLEKADKKADRETAAGLVYAYIHTGGTVGVLVEVNCETDFVARTDDFGNLCKEVGMQIASMRPETVEVLLAQPYIRDSKMTIEELVKSVIGKLGENIQIRRFTRYEIGG